MTLRRLSLLALCLCAVLAPSASAAPTLGTSVSISNVPGRIAAGPDGNIWVLIGGGGNEIAKITPAGVATEFNVPDLSGATGLTAGADGNLWATDSGAVVKVPPGDPTNTTATLVAPLTDPQDIVSGPGGNLWAASADKLIRIPPANPGTFQAFNNVVTGARGIAAGGDGQLWIADFGGDRVASVDTAGNPTYYAVGGGMQGIAAGPGTQVAYTQANAADSSVGRISPGGSVLKTPLGALDPTGITLGTDGAYWIAQFTAQNLARLTPDGQYTTPISFPANSGPRRITTGPGNTLWVSLETSNKVAVVRGVDPPAAAGTAAPDTTAPGVSALGMSDRTVVVGKGATAKVAAKTGTTIRYTLSEAAKVTLRFERKLAGRRVKRGKKRVCAKPTRKNRKKRKCTRYKSSGTLTRTSKQGKNSVKFSGRIGKKALKRGRYRLVVRATDAAGNKSKARTLSFRVVKPPKPKHKRR